MCVYACICSYAMFICMYIEIHIRVYKTVLVLHTFQYICFIERVGEDPTGPYLKVM